MGLIPSFSFSVLGESYRACLLRTGKKQMTLGDCPQGKVLPLLKRAYCTKHCGWGGLESHVRAGRPPGPLALGSIPTLSLDKTAGTTLCRLRLRLSEQLGGFFPRIRT
jgi:hypothetical protein